MYVANFPLSKRLNGTQPIAARESKPAVKGKIVKDPSLENWQAPSNGVLRGGLRVN